jgi:hypothetical protein
MPPLLVYNNPFNESIKILWVRENRASESYTTGTESGRKCRSAIWRVLGPSSQTIYK